MERTAAEVIEAARLGARREADEAHRAQLLLRDRIERIDRASEALLEEADLVLTRLRSFSAVLEQARRDVAGEPGSAEADPSGSAADPFEEAEARGGEPGGSTRTGPRHRPRASVVTLNADSEAARIERLDEDEFAAGRGLWLNGRFRVDDPDSPAAPGSPARPKRRFRPSAAR